MAPTQRIARTITEVLGIDHGDLDQDTGIALTSLITTAVHDEKPKHTLPSILGAIKESQCASELNPLTVIPIVIGSTKNGVDDILDLVSKECSAKEVVMAVEEAVETLERRPQSGEEDEGEEQSGRASAAVQVTRLIKAYTNTLPQLPRWKKSPRDAVETCLAELGSLISHISGRTTAQEGSSILLAASHLVLALSPGADEAAKEPLSCLIETTVAAFPNHFNAGLARTAFQSHFRRLVVPTSGPSTSKDSEDVVAIAWSALRSLDITTSVYERRPSLAAFVLLAHDAAYTFSTSMLTDFFPVILSSIQANVALDEVLSVLISTLAPMRSATTPLELDTDLIVPLAHLLPYLASNHSEPDIRHYTFRTLSLVLGLSPPPVRFGLLKDMLADEELPPQMGIAAIGLLKEAVLEAISGQGQNIFASRYLLAAFGPLVLRPAPLESHEAITLDEFLGSPEPLRLVECLGFYYVLLQRDQNNRTGVRDTDALRNVQKELLDPLKARVSSWASELDGHDNAIQFGILEMWVTRVDDAIVNIQKTLQLKP
ncbi:hypothetical protein C8Q73DRAFT_687966 [Cubamyces lactineus]|nr:hypothetical protein C8Q73DRAFT_687966 [Cubamyces lactineus]